MKQILTLFLLLVCPGLLAQEIQPFEFNKIYSYVLQGDVAQVLSVLDTLPASPFLQQE